MVPPRTRRRPEGDIGPNPRALASAPKRLTRSRSAPPSARTRTDIRVHGRPPVPCHSVATQTSSPPSPTFDFNDYLDPTIPDEDLIQFDTDTESTRTTGASCYDLYSLTKEEPPNPTFTVTFKQLPEGHRDFKSLLFQTPRVRTPSPPSCQGRERGDKLHTLA
jgi:hypothetical protein